MLTARYFPRGEAGERRFRTELKRLRIYKLFAVFCVFTVENAGSVISLTNGASKR